MNEGELTKERIINLKIENEQLKAEIESLKDMSMRFQCDHCKEWIDITVRQIIL